MSDDLPARLRRFARYVHDTYGEEVGPAYCNLAADLLERRQAELGILVERANRFGLSMLAAEAALAAALPVLDAADRWVMALETASPEQVRWPNEIVGPVLAWRAAQDQPTTEQPTPPKRITGEPPGWEGTRAVHERAVARFGRPSTEQPCPCCVGGTLQPEFDVACPVCGGSGRVPTTPPAPTRRARTIDCGEGRHAECSGSGTASYLFPQESGEQFICACRCHAPAGPEGATP